MNKTFFKSMKCLTAVALVLSMAASFSLSVEAAPMTREDGTVFDDAYYYITNPDVAKVCGSNGAALYNHYKNTGKAEGRLPADPSGRYYIWSFLMQDQADALFPKVDSILLQITNAGMTDRQKVDAVVNWMCENISYDYDYASNNYRGGRDSFAQYVLEDGLAVCDGYADVFQAFMYRLGIPCTYVSGYANEAHGWNSVKVDGAWYYIDVTWVDGYRARAESGQQYSNVYGLENIPDDIRERVLPKLQEANERVHQQMEMSYHLTDINTGWSDHTPQSYEVLSVTSGWDQLIYDIGG